MDNRCLCTFPLAAPYGTSISRMPVNMGHHRQHGFMMDPHGSGAAGGGGKLKVINAMHKHDLWTM